MVTRHLLVTYKGKQALVTFHHVNSIQHWIVNVADRVDYLTQEEVAKCTAPVGHLLYDELHEGGVLTMRVAAGVAATGGFLMPRKMVHVDSAMVGHDVEWKLALNS